MAYAKRFEDLEIWNDARLLCNDVYSHFKGSRDYGFRDQILRASVSVMNNIAEGFERKSNKEFIRFLDFSKASCGEVRSMLYLAQDLNYMDAQKAVALIDRCQKISVSIYKLQKYLAT